MRTVILSLAMGLLANLSIAQTKIQKSFSVEKGQELTLKFDYPQIIKITTWKQNEVSISGNVNINNGKNDSNFNLTESKNGQGKTIEGRVVNLKDIPHQVTATFGSEKKQFQTKEDYQKYVDANDIKSSSVSTGVQMDIVLEIKVPEHMKTTIESTYGTIEVINFDAPIIAQSTYGSVDATMNAKQIGEIKVETFFGKMYTNLDFAIKTIKSDNFHSVIAANVGKQPLQEFSSKYGNVYLRK